MAQAVIVDLSPATTPVTATLPAVSRRTVRVALQLVCFAGVLAAPLFQTSAVVALVVAQVLCAAGTYLVLRARGPQGAVGGTLRVWGVGALLSTASALWLADTFHGDRRATQLVAVVAVVLVAGLGRMRDAWNAAGSQLDAILATLPDEGAKTAPR